MILLVAALVYHPKYLDWMYATKVVTWKTLTLDPYLLLAIKRSCKLEFPIRNLGNRQYANVVTSKLIQFLHNFTSMLTTY